MKRKSRTSGPFQTARDGSVSIPIYRSQTRTGTVYRVTWYDGSRRMRRAFADGQEAAEFAAKRAKEISRLGTTSLALSGEDLLAYRRAVRLAETVNVQVDVALAEYVEAKTALGEVSIVTAAKEYAKLRPVAVDAPSVTDTVTEFLAAKEGAGRSERHVKDLRTRLTRFADAFQCKVSEVSLPDIEHWLASLKVGLRSRANYIGSTTNLIRFAERRGYIAKGAVDLSSIERGEDEGEISIFSPDELAQLLQHARPEIQPFIALGAFAGLRTAEICRLDWSEIGTEHIEIKAAKAKTRSRRFVPILHSLAAVIGPHRQASGPVCPLLKPWTSLRKAAAAAGIEWKHNALRHSFGTYRMAVLKNEAQVALEMGNTPGMVFRHYRAVATEETARKWFSFGGGRNSNLSD